MEKQCAYKILRLAMVMATAFSALFIVLWCTTPYGIGESPDSISYIDGARSIHATLLDGHKYGCHGFRWVQRIYPSVHFPPLYSALLSTPLYMGVDMLEGARWLNAILFMLTALAIGACTYACTQKSLLPSVVSIALFMFSTGMIKLYTYVLSETAFNLFALAAYLLLAWYISRPKMWILTASSLLLAMALLTRYAGISLILPMILAILLLQKSTLSVRFKACSLLLLFALSPLFLWCLRNYWMAHTTTGRFFAIHLIDPLYFKQFAETLSDFWLPIPMWGFIKLPLFLAGLVLTLCAFMLVTRHEIRSTSRFKGILLLLIGFYIVCHVSFLIASISFADAYTPLDYRILSSLLVFSVVFVSAIFWNASAITARRTVWGGYLIFVLVITYFNVGRTLPLMIRLHNEGIGYASSTWRSSACIAYVRSLPDTIPIYSNCPDGIYFLTGRKSLLIPRTISTYTRCPNPDFVNELDTLRNGVLHKGAVIVYINLVTWRYYLPKLQDLKDLYRFPILAELNDGTIFGVTNRQVSAVKR